MSSIQTIAASTLSHLCLASTETAGATISVSPNDVIVERLTRSMTGACIEDVNHEIYGGVYTQMVFGESFQEPGLPSTVDSAPGVVSGMWRPCATGSAAGRFRLSSESAWVGKQSQQMEFTDGEGVVTIENMGLNRSGMGFVARKEYEGSLRVRSARGARLRIALESRDGTRIYAEREIQVAPSADWTAVTFGLTSNATDTAGRLSIGLVQPGSVEIGYAFLQPGEWGRFKGLPCRKDVVEALQAQGITVLRYGGSMVNHIEYRWKKMIGPRDARPPYCGTWYPYSSNGWGIIDFLAMCRAAGFESVPAINMYETPQDVADFLQYVNGSPESEWGRKRVEDGYGEPFGLRYLQIGNEEAIDDSYRQRFCALAETIWEAAPEVQIIVGDFAYNEPIVDPYSFTGAPLTTSLEAHEQILRFAAEHGREVWFDIHTQTDAPDRISGLDGPTQLAGALHKICPEADAKVVMFEFNAGNHSGKRMLANAIGTNSMERQGKAVMIACSANCLQVDKQNDNDWDQGLLFMNSHMVWPQPPYFVTQMVSQNYLPQVVQTTVQCEGNDLDVLAKRSVDGDILQLQVVNSADHAVTANLDLGGFTTDAPEAQVTEISCDLEETNTAEEPNKVAPVKRDWRHDLSDGRTSFTFAPYSFTIIRFEGK